MNIRLIVDISKALLLARWRQTLVAAVGVTFSITMFIALLSFMTGMNKLLDGLILNRTPHIRLYKEVEANKEQPILMHKQYAKNYHFINSVKPQNTSNKIRNSGAIMQTLRSDNRVLGFSPKVNTQIFYNLGTVSLPGSINGIDVDAESKLFSFGDYVTEGNFIDLKNISNSIILGKGAAEKMMADIGDVIQITTSKGEIFQLKVVGYFQSGLADIDKVQSYASITTTQKLLGENNSYITDIQIKLKDLNAAPIIAKEYQKVFETNALDIQTANAQFETGTTVRSIISYSVGVTLLIVAGFGIYNILNMMIYEKLDSIAIMKATGFSGKDVNAVFIGIALTIGIFGGSLGLLFGFGFSHIIDNIPFNTAALPNIKTFPVNYDPKFYLIGGLFSLITTYFAGYFPAKKASNIDPVIIIRGK